MCLGSGTVTIPYIFYSNGIILSTVLICIGGILSYYTGYLIAYCAEKTGGKSFEEIAFKLYGEKGKRIVSFCNICCCLGFLIAYAVLFKTSMPKTLQKLGFTNLPTWLDDGFKG
jgi:amino acid permease